MPYSVFVPKHWLGFPQSLWGSFPYTVMLWFLLCNLCLFLPFHGKLHMPILFCLKVYILVHICLWIYSETNMLFLFLPRPKPEELTSIYTYSSIVTLDLGTDTDKLDSWPSAFLLVLLEVHLFPQAHLVFWTSLLTYFLFLKVPRNLYVYIRTL